MRPSVQSPSMHVDDKHGSTCPQSELSGDRERWAPGAHWSASVDKSASSSSMRDHVSHTKGEAMEKDIGRQPIASINPCVHACVNATWLSLAFIKLENYKNNSLTKSLGVVKSPPPNPSRRTVLGREEKVGLFCCCFWQQKWRETASPSSPRPHLSLPLRTKSALGTTEFTLATATHHAGT